MADGLDQLKRGGKSRRKPVFSFLEGKMRTRIYVDGYNLYYSCLKGTDLKWLDLLNLFQNEIFPSITLPNGQPLHTTAVLEPVAIKFFTALILAKAASAEDSLKCQEQYHAALKAHTPGRVEIIKGYYACSEARARAIDPNNPKKQPRDCAFVDVWKLEEKQSDVNLAIHALTDALTGEVDQVVIVTNDTDIAPAMEMIRQRTKVQIGLIIPTINQAREVNADLDKFAGWTRKQIKVDELKASQLPRVIKKGKSAVTKPVSWYAHADMLQKILAQGAKDNRKTSEMFQWLNQENPHWGKRKPLDMIEEGEGQTVLTYLEGLSAQRTAAPLTEATPENREST
jgi:6-hydroxy-3-succinoylpyridine 3-monooxygenase